MKTLIKLSIPKKKASFGAVSLFNLIETVTSCPISGILGTTIFFFSPNCWEWASNLEVFTLNVLLCILVLQSAVDYFQSVEYTEFGRSKNKVRVISEDYFLAQNFLT